MPDLELSDGARIYYEVSGAGPPVLMIHGVGIAGCAWSPQVEGLRERYRLVCYDNRGLGRSTLAGALSIERMAGDALALMDALGFDRAHVVGHSMGGVVAQELALRAPARVASLALLCTFARGKDAVALNPWIVWMGLRGQLGTRRMRRLASLEMVVPPSALSGDRDALAARFASVFGRDLADQPKIAMAQLRAMGKHDASARLGALASIPTLVVSAAHDRIAPPRRGRELARLTRGRYEEIAGAAHAVVVQLPERVNALLAAHLAAVDQGRGLAAAQATPVEP